MTWHCPWCEQQLNGSDVIAYREELFCSREHLYEHLEDEVDEVYVSTEGEVRR